MSIYFIITLSTTGLLLVSVFLGNLDNMKKGKFKFFPFGEGTGAEAIITLIIGIVGFATAAMCDFNGVFDKPAAEPEITILTPELGPDALPEEWHEALKDTEKGKNYRIVPVTDLIENPLYGNRYLNLSEETRKIKAIVISYEAE